MFARTNTERSPHVRPFVRPKFAFPVLVLEKNPPSFHPLSSPSRERAPARASRTAGKDGWIGEIK